MPYCEDYPCCGHTPADPCGRQWYDEPGAFDTTIPGNEHALCEHESGFCEVGDDDDHEDPDPMPADLPDRIIAAIRGEENPC